MHFNILGKYWIFPFLVLALLSGCDSYKVGSDYKTMAYNDAVSAGIPPQLFVNQINEESGFNPYAVSSAGAIGISQFMPSTAASLGIDPWNAEQSLQGAANLMASYQAKYGSYKIALAAYNCGTGCVQRAFNNCGYWYWCVPSETREYIRIIMS